MWASPSMTTSASDMASPSGRNSVTGRVCKDEYTEMAPGRGRRRGRPLHHPGRGTAVPGEPTLARRPVVAVGEARRPGAGGVAARAGRRRDDRPRRRRAGRAGVAARRHAARRVDAHAQRGARSTPPAPSRPSPTSRRSRPVAATTWSSTAPAPRMSATSATTWRPVRRRSRECSCSCRSTARHASWPTTSTSPTAAWSHRMERRSSSPSRRPTGSPRSTWRPTAA